MHEYINNHFSSQKEHLRCCQGRGLKLVGNRLLLKAMKNKQKIILEIYTHTSKQANRKNKTQNKTKTNTPPPPPQQQNLSIIL